MPDIQLLNNFRAWVNSNDWTFFEYTNKDNKNKWNCICSAMDWIDVSIRYINTHPLAAIRDDSSIELFSYLACVDIVVEAIEQLNRVINSTGKQVFENDKSCFVDNPFNQTDREYFKTLRACFGAHPINLDDPKEPNNKDAKRFASWSSGFEGTGDFNVYLYSNKIGEKNIVLEIKYSQVDDFLEKYYSCLSDLMTTLQNQLTAFCKMKQKEDIPHSDDPIEHLTILQKECANRLNNEYYRITIEELLRTFQTPITCDANLGLVDRYLDVLKREIEEIHCNLQKMTLCGLSVDKVSMRKLPLQDGWEYWVSKLDEARLGHGYPALFWLETIEEIFEGYFAFEYESLQELYVLVKATICTLTE